jgi:two-component sensor histidine kinase
MSLRTPDPAPEIPHAASGAGNGQQPPSTMTAELQAALAREEALLREMRTQEFEHRLINSLQLISSLLSLQSRTATTPEAAAQLTIASQRVAALGRVHRRLHLLDHQDNVKFRQYVQQLCEDLAGLLFNQRPGHAILVEGADFEIPTGLGIPLGFIVNELITNCAKYAKGNIAVRLETASPDCHSLSVSDDGPGLPTGFDPANSKGLGMKIVLSLVKQIDGELHISAGDNAHGTRFTVVFRSPRPGTNGP